MSLQREDSVSNSFLGFDDGDEEEMTEEERKRSVACFQRARDLRMVPQFMDACFHNSFTHHRLFRHVLAPEAQRLLDVTLHCLTKRLPDPSLAEWIVSYLSAPQFVVPVKVFGVQSTPKKAQASFTPSRFPTPTEASVTLAATPGSAATKPDATPPTATVRMSGAVITPSSAAAATPQQQQQQQQQLPSAAPHTAPAFFLRPPYDKVTSLFVRMGSSHLLTDEELNRYFGRYGQVRAVLLQSHRVVVVPSKRSLPSSSSYAEDSSTMLHQDFRIDVDMPENVVAALREVRNPEVLFLAPSHASRNCYRCSDVPSAAAWRTVSGLRGVSDEEDTAEGSSLSHHNRQAPLYHMMDEEDFVPEVCIDQLPYWATPAQISEHCSAFGTVKQVRLSISDRNGSFTGAALVLMATCAQAQKLAEGVHDSPFGEDGVHATMLVAGVLDEQLHLVSFMDGTVKYKENLHPPGLLDSVSLNPRVWV